MMMKHEKSLRQILGLILVAFLLAGCGGGSAKVTATPTPVAEMMSEPQAATPTANPPTPTTVPPTPTPSLGKIEGKIVAEPGAKIAGEVTLSGPVDLSTKVDDQAYYSFADLQPGDYTIQVRLSIIPCTMTGPVVTNRQFPVPAILIDSKEWEGVNFLVADLEYPIGLKSSFGISAGEAIVKDIDICH
jgi:hypothetical protein